MCLTPRVQPLCTVKHQELLKCVYGFLFMHICVLTFGGETLSWPVHTVTPRHCHGWRWPRQSQEAEFVPVRMGQGRQACSGAPLILSVQQVNKRLQS